MKKQGLDLLAMVEGCFLVALGVLFLKTGDLVSGGTTGLALLADGYFASGSFGLWLFAINLPFYWLGLRKLGWPFVVKTFFCVALVGIMVDVLQPIVHLEVPYPLLNAVFSGMLLAFGMSFLFKVGASLGGVNILALFLQQRLAIPAARTMLVIDLMIMACALLLYGWTTVLYSALCVAILSAILGRHYRPATAPTTATAQPADS